MGTPKTSLTIWIRALVAVAITGAIAAAMIAWLPMRFYDWVKAAHIISLIAWMAGMLYLPRLFVYHCEAELGSKQSETFKVMERRLLRGIINPALVATWVFGLWLAIRGGWYTAGWLQTKVILVLAMSGLHGMLSRWVRDFATDANRHSQKFYRIINEVPTLLMIAIVILAVVKPF